MKHMEVKMMIRLNYCPGCEKNISYLMGGTIFLVVKNREGGRLKELSAERCMRYLDRTRSRASCHKDL